jgi:hypothetical protein
MRSLKSLISASLRPAPTAASARRPNKSPNERGLPDGWSTKEPRRETRKEVAGLAIAEAPPGAIAARAVVLSLDERRPIRAPRSAPPTAAFVHQKHMEANRRADETRSSRRGCRAATERRSRLTAARRRGPASLRRFRISQQFLSDYQKPCYLCREAL